LFGTPLAPRDLVRSRLIVNPAAGSDRGAELAGRLRERLSERFGDVDLVTTAAEGDANRAARDAARRHYDYIFVAGGDGTLNEAVNGVAADPSALAGVTLGVVPIGTGNDFASALGIPDDLDQAIDALGRAEPRQIDLGRLDDQFFVNVSAGGFIAEVSDAVSTQLKTIAGKLAYLIGGAQVLMSHEPIVAHYRTGFTAGRSTLETFAVCNSRLIGGGRLIAPDAVLDDGELDVCLIEDMPPVEFIGLLRRVSAGEHLADERVRYFRTRELQMTFDRRVKVNVDGQVLETDRCSYSVLPQAIRFLQSTVNSVD
jgi:diacylglycerol kinase (ATP)